MHVCSPRVVIALWLNASLRIQPGVVMNRSAFGQKVFRALSSYQISRYMRTYLTY